MLSDRQRQIYQFIRDHVARFGVAPKLREIGDHVGINSRGTVHRHVKALEQAGLIEIDAEQSRGIQLLDQEEQPAGLPLLGRIAAGCPIEAIAGQERIDLGGFFMGAGRYVLKVQGDSMIDDGILDGDMVVVRHCDRAENGAIVVALIDNEEATLKRIYRNDDGTVTLQPANSAMAPMRYSGDRVTLQGVVVGQFRAYD
ncbi:MAG: transcriptional repressor LexA [Gammaproteobacteria bacterium]|nr:transcriptional repressor LexA [Gammaproteobacteria bacterium]